MRIRNGFFYFVFPECIHHNGQEESPRCRLSLLPVYVTWASNTCCVTCWCQRCLQCPADRTHKPLVPPRWGDLVSNARCWPRAPITPNSQSLPNTEVSPTDPVTGPRQKGFFEIHPEALFGLLPKGLFPCAPSCSVEALGSTHSP